MPQTGRVDRNRLNVVFIGHESSGKSTTAGQLLYQLGKIPQETLERYEQESNGKPQAKYAWIMDKLKEERERGMTVDIALMQFKSERFKVTIIDAPGHRDFIKNMITGASEADAAILVLSAVDGEFEHSISREGETREHVLLAYNMGVKQLVVAVNKMDKVDWSRERWDHIVQNTSEFITKIGFTLSQVAFVPISGWCGDNIVRPSSSMPSWYTGWTRKSSKGELLHGHTLLQAIDAIDQPSRLTKKPLRLPLQDVYKISGVGTVPVGRIESGILRPGQTVKFSPSGIVTTVESVKIDTEVVTEALPGDFVGFHAKNTSVQDIRRGFVVSDPSSSPALPCHSFTAHIVILNHPGNIKEGYTPTVDVHRAHVACTFAEFIAKIDPRSAKTIEDRPKTLKAGDAAIVKLVPTKPLVVEAFSEYPALGRFAVRDMRQTIAVGIIQSVEIMTESEELNEDGKGL